MTRPSAKRKAASERGRRNIGKRWKKENNEALPGGSGATPSTSHVCPPSTTHETPAPPLVNHVTAAAYRHSLLPESNRQAKNIRECNAITHISLERLQNILQHVSCPECGKKCTSKVISEYFDCTINIRCDDCREIIHYSEPEKCRNSDISVGNVIQV